ncbi:MAG: recombinase family protein, partial [Eubacteriales bacterium]|nr:recombinase family protein [Eubacteriales bacterium]
MEITVLPAMLKVPPRLRRVAAYARVSSGKDAMLHSLSAQVSYYSELIQKNPAWSYVGVYADEDYTGTRDARPEFQRLLADCRAGAVDLVLTKSVSRFARNTLTTLNAIRELKLLGIDCYFEEESIHSMSEDGELVLTLLASYAQEESLFVSENCKWKIRHGFQ